MTLYHWAAIVVAFSIWAYWPRLADRIRRNSKHQEQPHDGDTTP